MGPPGGTTLRIQISQTLMVLSGRGPLWSSISHRLKTLVLSLCAYILKPAEARRCSNGLESKVNKLKSTLRRFEIDLKVSLIEGPVMPLRTSKAAFLFFESTRSGLL